MVNKDRNEANKHSEYSDIHVAMTTKPNTTFSIQKVTTLYNNTNTDSISACGEEVRSAATHYHHLVTNNACCTVTHRYRHTLNPHPLSLV